MNKTELSCFKSVVWPHYVRAFVIVDQILFSKRPAVDLSKSVNMMSIIVCIYSCPDRLCPVKICWNVALQYKN